MQVVVDGPIAGCPGSATEAYRVLHTPSARAFVSNKAWQISSRWIYPHGRLVPYADGQITPPRHVLLH